MSFLNINFPCVRNVASTTLCNDYYYESEERLIKRKRILKFKRILNDDNEFFKIISKDEYNDIIEIKYDCCQKGLISVKPLSQPTINLNYIDYIYKQ